MKPETEIRNLKRELKDALSALSRRITEVGEYRVRATKAEQECAEWKRRFDMLLSGIKEYEPPKG